MLVRSDNEAVVVNLDIEPVEKPEAVPGSTRSTRPAGSDTGGGLDTGVKPTIPAQSGSNQLDSN